MDMRKQLMRKFTTALLALTLLLSTVINVNAAPTIGATPTLGSLTINKEDENKKPVEDAVFTLFRIMDLTPGTGVDVGTYSKYTLNDKYKEIPGFLAMEPDALKNYSATEIEAMATAIWALENANATATNTGLEMPATDEHGVTTRGSIPLGCYLVVETGVPAGYVAAKPFFVAIPSTNNYAGGVDEEGNPIQTAGTAWEYDVEVTPKNRTIDIVKEITNANGDHENGTSDTNSGESDTVAVGDMVRYSVTTTVPHYTAEYFVQNRTPNFIITDRMSAGLQIVDEESTANPKATHEAVVVSDGATLTPVTDYTITTSNLKNAANPDLRVQLTKEYLINPANHGKTLTVSYAAKVTSAAVIGEVGNPNKVTLTYASMPGLDINGDPYDEDDDDEKFVYTFQLNVVKTVEGRETALAGAEFDLFKADKTGNITATKVGSGTSVADTGLISFARLDAGSYYLVETKSPVGYTLLTNPIKITIIATENADGPTGEITFEIDNKPVTADEAKDGLKFQSYFDSENGIVSVAVENKVGFSLPGTGGVGVTIFLAVAFIGMLTISVVLLKRKKA